MTFLAGHDLGIDAKMVFPKIGVCQLMTLRTQLVNRLAQEGDFLGSVGLMAASAAFRGRKVDLLALELGAHLLVASQTHLRPRNQQQLFLLGIMRTVPDLR